MTFYDFESTDLELHKRSILFLQLDYGNDEDQMEYEIRHRNNHALEEQLSLDLLKYYKEV